MMVLFKDLVREAHKLGLHTKGLTYSQILRHVEAERAKRQSKNNA